MFNLLVVEDQVDFYQDYLLRIFSKLLPMDKISVTHVSTLEAALVALKEPWNFILMDFSMGPKVEFDGAIFRDGSDLISFRRGFEDGDAVPEAFILGTSSNQVGNRLMAEKGANQCVLKIEVPEMAKKIKDIYLIKTQILDKGMLKKGAVKPSE